MNFSLGSLTSTSEGWGLISGIAGIIFSDDLIKIPESIASNPDLMAWIYMAKIFGLSLIIAIYINGRSRVKEAANLGGK